MSLGTIRAATDGGLRVLAEAGDRIELEGRKVHWLEAHSGERWALVNDTELWHQASGEEWEQAASSALALRCLLPLEEGVLVGTEEAHLLRHGREGLEPVASFEFARGREEWFTPWGGPADVRSMALAADGIPFVNVHVGGILRSADEGTRWAPTIDLHADVHEVIVVPERPGWLLAATIRGLGVSQNSGESWTFDDGGLDSTYCRAVGLCGDTVLLSASNGPHGGHAALYRRALDAEGFTRCEAGLPDEFPDNIDTGCVAGSGTMAAFGTKDGRVFVSEDEGSSWRLLRDDLAYVHRVLIEGN